MSTGLKPRRCSTRWAPSPPSSSATRPDCSRRSRLFGDRSLIQVFSLYFCSLTVCFGSVSVDAPGASGAQHEAGAADPVHRRRRGLLRRQRGRLLGVRIIGVRVPPEPAQRAEVGERAHQRRRVSAERRLPARTLVTPSS